MPQTKAEVVLAIFDTLRRDDIEAGLALVDPEVEFIPLSANVEGRIYRGHDGVRKWDRERKETWDLEFEFFEFTEVGDALLIRGSIRATGKSSGAAVDTPVWWVMEFRNGKVRRVDTFTDAERARAVAETRTGVAG